jgi:AcrR family transcriptional regulator
MDNKSKIIEEAAQLFKTYGIRSMTMDLLANHMAISKRTIYEIFADKDELLIGVLQWMSVKQKQLIEKVLNDSENTIVAIFKLLEFNRDHFQQMSPAFQADIKKFTYQILEDKADKFEMPDHRSNMEVIKRGIKEKLFRKDINPDLVNTCMNYLFISAMDNDLYPFEKYSRHDVVLSTVINYLRGISTPEGIKMIDKMERKF